MKVTRENFVHVGIRSCMMGIFISKIAPSQPNRKVVVLIFDLKTFDDEETPFPARITYSTIWFSRLS